MINRANYILQKEYLDYVQNVHNRTAGTVQRAKTHTSYILIWLDETHLSESNTKDGNFPQFVAENRQRGQSTNERLYSGLHPTTQEKVIQTTKRFLNFLKLHKPELMKSLPAHWIEDLTPVPSVEIPSEHIFISFDEIQKIANHEVPENDIRLLRAQASAGFLFLSASRNDAYISSPIKAIDLEKLEYRQWPKYGVRTKNRIHRTTFLLDIPEILEPVRKWDRFVREKLPPDSMWFAPLVTNNFGKKNKLSMKTPGVKRSKRLNKDLEYLAEKVGFEYKSAHKYRHGHAVFALLNCKTMAQFKAVSQNLMHEDIKVTDSIYAWLNEKEIQTQLMSLDFKSPNHSKSDTELQSFLQNLSIEGLQDAITMAAKMLANS